MTKSADGSDDEAMEVRRLSKDAAYPASFTQAFGELMLEFAAIEGDLFGLTIDLATDDFFHGAILLAGVAYTGLVDRFCALILHITRGDAGFEAAVDDVRRQLVDVGDRRNRLVHSEWFLEPIAGSMSRIKASAKGKSGLRFDTPTVPLSELTDLVRDLRTVRRRCNELGGTVFDLYRKKPSGDSTAI